MSNSVSAAALLDEFSRLPGRVERPRTFMEIAGYPHYENVCSNFLAFFLDPEESHGLGTLLLDTLAQAGGLAAAGEGMGGNVSIEREVTTEADNRIDLLIETDTKAVLIENKVFASVVNPFADYAAYLDHRISDDYEKHKLLLTLSPTDEGGEWGFANLTYDELVNEARSRLGHYVAGADTRYLTMFLDLLNTLENLQEGSSMDPGFIKLLLERQEEAESFFYEMTKFKGELRKKVRELRSLIDVEGYRNVKQSLYREQTNLHDVLVHNISISGELVVSVDTVIVPQGWGIWIWPRSGNYFELRELLRRLEIPLEEYEREGGFSHRDSFAYDESLDKVRVVIQNLVDRLAESQE